VIGFEFCTWWYIVGRVGVRSGFEEWICTCPRPTKDWWGLAILQNEFESFFPAAFPFLFVVLTRWLNAAVDLKLASLVIPAQMKKVKTRTSVGCLRPLVKPTSAGATPNEIMSANESSSWPSTEDSHLNRATFPSRKSDPSENIGRRQACFRWYRISVVGKYAEEKIESELHPPLTIVIRSASRKFFGKEKFSTKQNVIAQEELFVHEGGIRSRMIV